jgi:hypothetical protein
MQSPPLLVTIFHYSIPEGMLGRGLNKYQGFAADCLQPPLHCGFQQQLKPGVRLQSPLNGSFNAEGRELWEPYHECISSRLCS